MTSDHPSRPRGRWLRWQRRFADAFQGIWVAFRDQESLWVHAASAVAVIAISSLLQIDAWRWCVLILCIFVVISLEMMNSAIERLVKTLHPEHDSGLAETLHMAAAAVLVAAMGSVLVGLIVLLPSIVRLF